MADSDQTLGSIGLVQRWKEFVTGIHVRLMGAALYGISSGGSSEIPVKVSSGGGIYVELQPSTEVVGLLGASTAVIGHIIADASTARIGSLYPSTEIIGGLYASTAKIGALQGSTEVIGYTIPAGSTWITLLASTARSTSPVSSDQTNVGYRGHVLQMLYETSTGASITPTLEIKEQLSTAYKTIWTAASAITTTGHYAYLFDLGGVGSAGSYDEAVNIRLGYQWRLNVTQSSSGATTYTATMDLLV